MRALWLPGGPLWSSDEAYALEDLNPPPDPTRDPWATPTRQHRT